MDDKSVTDGQSVRSLRSNRSGYLSSNGSLQGSSSSSTTGSSSIAALIKGSGEEEGLYLHRDLHRKKAYLVGRIRLKQRWYKPSHQVTNFAQLPSLEEVSLDGTLAAKRSNVLRARLLIEDDIKTLSKKNDATDDELNERSKAKTKDLLHKIKEKMLWAYPPIVSMHKAVVEGYCQHLLSLLDTPPLDERGDLKVTTPYKHVQLLESWTNKYRGTASEKVAVELERLVKAIRQTVLWRDRDFYARKGRLLRHETATNQKKESRLRWMIETNVGRKDRFYTIWHLAQHCLLDQLKRFSTGAAFTRVDERDPDHGLTALHYACRAGHLDVVRFLLSLGADPNQRAPDGRTALHFAAAYSSKEIVYELLANCADVDARDDYGCRSLDLARQNRNDKVCSALEGWSGLVPPEERQEAADADSAADEYTTTDASVIARMSPQLRTLTRRLEGIEGLSVARQAVRMQPLVEVRLSEKHALLCLKEGFQFEAIKSLRRRWNVVKGLVGLEEQADYAHPSSEERVSADRYACEGTLVSRVVLGDLGLGEGAGGESTPKRCASMNVSAVADIGLDFAETLIADKIEGFACSVLKDCLKLKGLDMTKQIVLLVRSSEVQLCLHDLLQGSGDRATIRTQMQCPQKAQMAHREGFIAAAAAAAGANPDDSVGDCDDDSLTVDSCAHSVDSRLAAHWYDTRDPALKLQALLADCMLMLRRALTLHSIIYRDDIVEPCTLSPLLELLGDVAERQGLLLQSLDLMNYAHIVCCRTLGPSSEESIRVGLQALRLQMRATTTFEGVRVANSMSKELGNNLNVLALTDELAANRLSTRCAVLSLSRMFNSSGLVDGSVKVVTADSIRKKDAMRAESEGLLLSKAESRKKLLGLELTSRSKAERAEAEQQRALAEGAAGILKYDPLTDGLGPSRFQSFDNRRQLPVNVQTYDFGLSYEDVTSKYFDSFEIRWSKAGRSQPQLEERRHALAAPLAAAPAEGSLAICPGRGEDESSVDSGPSQRMHGWYL